LNGREGCRRPMTVRFTLIIRRRHELPGPDPCARTWPRSAMPCVTCGCC
jgi:hypothetical protein